MTQAELGRRLGLPQTAISRWERGQVEPSFENVRRAVRACGLDLVPQLVMRDDSNTALIEQQLRLTPAQRFAQNTQVVNFIEQARSRVGG